MNDSALYEVSISMENGETYRYRYVRVDFKPNDDFMAIVYHSGQIVHINKSRIMHISLQLEGETSDES